MPKYVFNEVTDIKITKQQVLDWIAQLKAVDLRPAGSLLDKDFSYNDADLTLHTHPCKDITKQLPSADFPIEIFCRVCGAVIRYNPETDTWNWSWSDANAQQTLEFPLDKTGVSAKDFWDLKEVVDDLVTKQAEVK